MNDGKTCSTNKGDCGSKKCGLHFILPILAVWATIFVFEWVFHGMYMMPKYEATASMWRSMEDMQQYCYINLIRQFVTALVISMLYCCATKNAPCCGKCPKTGLKFGLMIGALLGISNFGSFAWLPFPSMEIPASWLVGWLIEGALIGSVLALLKRICKKDDTSCTKDAA